MSKLTYIAGPAIAVVFVLAGAASTARAQKHPPPARHEGHQPAQSSSSEADAGVPAQPPTPEEAMQARLDAADAQLTQQQQQLAAQQTALAAQQTALAALKKQLDADHAERAKAEQAAKKAAAKKATEAPPVRSKWPTVTLSGYVQSDLQFRQSSQDQLNPSTSQPLNQDRFTVRRARLHIDADYHNVSLALEGGFNTVNGPQARLVSTELSWRLPGAKGAPPLIMATMGLFKIPFGYEVGQSDRDRLFMERSTMEHAFFPGEYDVGARLLGGWRFLRYAIAVQNGNPVGDKSFPGRDPNKAKDIVGRVGVDTTLGGGRVHVAAGFSGLTGKGFAPGSPATKPVVIWTDYNHNNVVDINQGEITSTPGQAATPSQNFNRFGIGGDLELGFHLPVIGLLDVYGEFTSATNLDRGLKIAIPSAVPGTDGGPRDVREFGWYAAVTQQLGPYFLIGARYDYYNPDADSTDLSSGTYVPKNSSYSTWALAGAATFQHGRLTLEYDINRNHLGRDTAGHPTNLKDNAVTLRGQVQF